MNLFQCWSVRNVLDLFVDERLTRAAMARVEAHVEACANCREELEALRPLDLAGLGTVVVPAGLTAAILKKHAQDAAPGTPTPDWRELLSLQPAQALALVYCVALFGINTRAGIPSQGTRLCAHASAHTAAAEPVGEGALQ